MDYDAVVIGAGVGGCAAGAALAGAGKKVLVLERMGEVGGRCSTSTKDGFKMDTGSHVIYQAGYGPFLQALKRVNKENDVDFYYIQKMMLRVGDRSLKMNIGKVMDTMEKILPSFVLKMMGMTTPVMEMMSNMMMPITYFFDKFTIRSLLAPVIPFKPVQNVIDWLSCTMYGTGFDRTPMGELMRTLFQAFGPMTKSMSEGNMFMGYVKGGLAEYPKALCRGIEEHGGEVRTGVDVKKILVENGKVTGVELETGEVIKTNLVISNGGIKETVKNLVGEDKFDKKYVDYIKSLKNGICGWCLRLALDEPFVDYDFILSIPDKDNQELVHQVWDDHIVIDRVSGLMATSPSRMDPTLAPPGKQSVIVIGPHSFEPKENWPKWEEKAFEAIECVFPGISDHVMWHDFLTPTTYLALGEEESPAVGIAQCMGQAGADRPSSESPIEGLYYVGAEAGKYAFGVATEMATMSGLNCADYLIRQERTPSPIQKIRNMIRPPRAI
ncbi:MAG: NAD(P)/FAD-dependent oxidoreductase [Actinobacteria bacterium]|nr:NAD(P)/FAD-dependent oxidoreductase [Actinomycetota bacterium]